MIYVGGRELSISLTKIEFVSISGLILCQGYYITMQLLVLRDKDSQWRH